MTVVVFTGPTFRKQDWQGGKAVEFLPPAAQGDVYRAAKRRPWAIGIIDGYFERVPSVWHKEILWAMQQGILVFGSSSMGALRAAELSAFGMVGIGEVFRSYAEGALEDDDEVAVAHCSAEDGFRPVSEAMVNIRSTVAAAVAAEIIDESTATLLLACGKRLHYAARTYPQILAHARAEGAADRGLPEFEAWLPRNRVNQKKRDAFDMLRHIEDLRARGVTASPCRFRLERTVFWEEARKLVDGEPTTGEPGEVSDDVREDVVDELVLDRERCRQLQREAMLRRLQLDLAHKSGMAVEEESVARAIERFRRQHGLLSEASIEEWLRRNSLDAQTFRRLMIDEARIAWVEDLVSGDLAQGLVDVLLIRDEYAELRDRANAKSRRLRAVGLEEPEPGDVCARDLSAFLTSGEDRPALADDTRYRRAALRELAFQRLATGSDR